MGAQGPDEETDIRDSAVETGGFLHDVRFRIQRRLRLLRLQCDSAVYCTVLYSTVQYCTVQYCTVLYCTVLYSIVLYCTVLYSIVLYNTTVCCTSGTEHWRGYFQLTLYHL